LEVLKHRIEETMSDQEDYSSRRIVPWYSKENLQRMRRIVAGLKDQRAALLRDPNEKPPDDNERLKGILVQLSAWSEAADKVALELDDWSTGEQNEWQESSSEPPPIDPAWIRNESDNMDASWFTKRLYVKNLRSTRGDGSYYKPLLDAYRKGDELWEWGCAGAGRKGR
jgi:hypothetical protein